MTNKTLWYVTVVSPDYRGFGQVGRGTKNRAHAIAARKRALPCSKRLVVTPGTSWLDAVSRLRARLDTKTTLCVAHAWSAQT